MRDIKIATGHSVPDLNDDDMFQHGESEKPKKQEKNESDEDELLAEKNKPKKEVLCVHFFLEILGVFRLFSWLFFCEYTLCACTSTVCRMICLSLL